MAAPRDAFISRAREGDTRVIRQAARNKTRKGNGLRDYTVDPSRFGSFHADQIQTPGAPGLRQALGAGKQLVKGVVNEVKGAERTAQVLAKPPWQTTDKQKLDAGAYAAMAWARPVKGGKIAYDALRPSWRVPTASPEWEIIANKAGDQVVGIAGGLKDYAPYPMRQTGAELIHVYRDLVKQARAIGSRVDYNEAQLRAAIKRRANQPLPMAFSVVEPGSKVPHASLTQELNRSHTDVDTIANLHAIQSGRRGAGMQDRYRDIRAGRIVPGVHEGKEIPAEVMTQLFQNAIAPEKPISAFMVNERLAQLMAAYAKRHGIELRDSGPYGGLGR